MQPFDTLTKSGQVRRLARLARAALEEYDLPGAQLKPIAHWENTTFRADAAAPRAASDEGAASDDAAAYEPNRFLLRVHSAGYQNPARIASEMAWLRALREEAELVVPIHLSTRDSRMVVVAESPGVPQPRACSVLRWVRGRFCASPGPSHYHALGELMARLHNHGARWKPGPEFERRRWDWDGFFGSGAGLGSSNAEEVWSLVPPQHLAAFETVAYRAQAAMDELGYQSDAWGLIHADLHWQNVLISPGSSRQSKYQLRPIDFDDCGPGHWIYDFAVVLRRQVIEPSAQHSLEHEALLRGYARHRPVPVEQMRHLKIIIAARSVAIALWRLSRARDNPAFRETLAAHLERAGQSCWDLLRPE